MASTASLLNPNHSKHVPKGSRRPSLHQQIRGHHDSCVVYLCKEASPESNKPKSSACRLYKMLIVSAVLMVGASLVFVWATSSAIEKRVLNSLKSAQAQHAVTGGANPSQSQGGLSLVKRKVKSGRKKGGKRRRRNLGRRCCRHQNLQPGAIHLPVSPENSFEHKNDRAVSGNFFIWSEGESHRSIATFSYNRVNRQQGNDILGVIVNQPGQYEVYSQVVVHGLEAERPPYNCAQGIVRIRRGSKEVLLKSFITQTVHGSSQEDHATSAIWRPLDSSFQFGIFMLHGGDELRVSYRNNCDHVRFSNVDPKAMFFGVAKR